MLKDGHIVGLAHRDRLWIRVLMQPMRQAVARRFQGEESGQVLIRIDCARSHARGCARESQYLSEASRTALSLRLARAH